MNKDFGKQWSPEEIAFLKANYNETADLEKLAIRLDRTARSIFAKAQKLGLKTKEHSDKTRWTDSDQAFLEANHQTMTYREIGIELGYSPTKIKTKIKQLAVERLRRDWWSPEEIEILKTRYNMVSSKQLLMLLPKRSRSAIYGMAQTLGLVRHRNSETSPEREVATVLKSLGIAFTRPKIQTGMLTEKGWVMSVKPDFFIEPGVVIEVQGNYYHCNPAYFPDGPINRMQENNRKRDERKKAFYESQGFTVLYLWEDECYEPDLVEKIRTVVYADP